MHPYPRSATPLHRMVKQINTGPSPDGGWHTRTRQVGIIKGSFIGSPTFVIRVQHLDCLIAMAKLEPAENRQYSKIHCVSIKKVLPFYFCDNFSSCKPILIISGRNIAERIWNKLEHGNFDIYSFIHQFIFSERELKFTFAICHRRSVCRLSVTFVRPTQTIEIFRNVSTP